MRRTLRGCAKSAQVLVFFLAPDAFPGDPPLAHTAIRISWTEARLQFTLIKISSGVPQHCMAIHRSDLPTVHGRILQKAEMGVIVWCAVYM